MFQMFITCDIINMINRYLLVCLVLLSAMVNSELQQVNHSQFNQLIKGEKWILAQFVIPQCGQCNYIHGQIQALNELSLEKNYKVVQINCQQEHQLCSSVKIQSYPTISLFANSQSIPYSGEKTSSSIDTWISNVQGEKYQKIDTIKLKEIEGKQKFLLFGGLNKEQNMAVSATKLSRYIGIPFYQIQSKSPILSFYQTDGSNKIDYSFPIDPRILSYELFHRSRDHVMSLDHPHYLHYFYNQRDSDQIIVFYNHFDSTTESAEKVLASVCHQHLVTILCFKIDIKSLNYNAIANQFNPPEAKTTIVYSIQNKNQAFFYPKSKIFESEFRHFLKEAKSKKIVPNFNKEEQIKKKITYKDVTILTESTHNSTIKENRFVIVQYFSPYCGYCVFLAPKYEQLAKQTKQSGLPVVVAAVDLTNDQKVGEWQNIEGYPTIKLFIQGTALEYKGQRSTEDILSYLTGIIRAKINSVSQLKDIIEPAVIITGIDSSSVLHSLPALFSAVPIYHLTSQTEFGIRIHNKQIKKYQGKVDLLKIVDWLEEQTDQVLVSLGSAKVPKKLQLAMQRKKPILAIINKGQQGSIKPILDILTDYCANITEFVCGYANKGQEDYDHIVQWIADPNPTSNRIVWINTRDLKSFLYEDSLADLSALKITQFIQNIKNGVVKENIRPETEEKGQATQQTLQTNTDQGEPVIYNGNKENEEL